MLTALALIAEDRSGRPVHRPPGGRRGRRHPGRPRAGSVYTADDLWHALLMSSANDAATGLAAMAGGTTSATARDARRRPARLGAADTRAVNTSGLDEPGQVSSAYDLALFGRAALADP